MIAREIDLFRDDFKQTFRLGRTVTAVDKRCMVYRGLVEGKYSSCCKFANVI
jgi:hypothetical protein